jgi:hypothetical protein
VVYFSTAETSWEYLLRIISSQWFTFPLQKLLGIACLEYHTTGKTDFSLLAQK